MTDKHAVSTPMAPAAIGPYSQAIVAGDWVFTSGQIGMDPVGGAVVGGGIVAETTQVFSNLTAVLAAAGCGLADVVKTTVFLADMDDFSLMNGVYEAHFGEPFPARSTVQAAKLPKGVSVEIECVALRHRIEE